MDKFESLIEEMMAAKRKPEGLSPKANFYGSPKGEQREIVIRYAIGREAEARVTEGSKGKSGMNEDSLAMMWALGKIIGESTGLDGKEVGEEIVAAVVRMLTKKMVEEVIGNVFD